MAKTIKFNLIIDGSEVRSVNELRENFCIEDVVSCYRSGLLKKWLEVRGFKEQFDKVNTIADDDRVSLNLLEAFDLAGDENAKIGMELLKYKENRLKQIKEYEAGRLKVKDIIDEYHKGYESVIDNIMNNRDNAVYIKAQIKEIGDNYEGLFKLNFRELYIKFINNAPLAVFAVIINPVLKKYFIADKGCTNTDTLQINSKIEMLAGNKEDLRSVLGKYLKIFKGDTSSLWKDIEPAGGKFVIICADNGCTVKEAGKQKNEYYPEDINGKFPVFDGIIYKSGSSCSELYYLEV